MKTSDNTESLTPGNRLEKRIIFFAVNLLAVYGPYLILMMYAGRYDWLDDISIFLSLPLAVPIVVTHAPEQAASWAAAFIIMATCIYFHSKVASLVLFVFSLISIGFFFELADALAHS